MCPFTLIRSLIKMCTSVPELPLRFGLRPFVVYSRVCETYRSVVSSRCNFSSVAVPFVVCFPGRTAKQHVRLLEADPQRGRLETWQDTRLIQLIVRVKMSWPVECIDGGNKNMLQEGDLAG